MALDGRFNGRQGTRERQEECRGLHSFNHQVAARVKGGGVAGVQIDIAEPRFEAEPVLARALDVYADFPDSTYVGATQLNFESIHKHDAFAEAFGTFGEFRRELRAGAHVDEKTDLAGWLGTRPSPAVSV